MIVAHGSDYKGLGWVNVARAEREQHTPFPESSIFTKVSLVQSISIFGVVE